MVPLQVHVTVKGRNISDPVFMIKGKRSKKTARGRVPKDLRDCLEQAKKLAGISERPQIAFAGPVQELLVSPRIEVAPAHAMGQPSFPGT